MDLKNYSNSAKVWALRHYGEVGPRTFRALIGYFSDVEAIHGAGLEELKSIEGLGEKRSQKIFEASNYLEEAAGFINSLNDINIKHCTALDENYPDLFEELNDPPPIIFYRGELPANEEKRVAIVGSHEASNAGISVAVELASQLSNRSVSIVSGLASGIDAAAHVGALKAGGKTYAVLGSGLEHIYPEENRALAVEVMHHGGLITEYAPDTKSSPGYLLARNRLIVGLSQAVIIGEVFHDSAGTIDTATFCHEIGKLMFVLLDGNDVPGHDNAGLEKALELGAIPVHLAKDVDTIAKSLV